MLLHFSIVEDQKKYQSINQRINQSVRYYRVPSSVEKGAALNLLLTKIENGQKPHSKTISLSPFLKYSVGIAAAAVIILAFILFSGKENITNSSLQALSVRLPDQSRVVLTHKSELGFKKRFANRIVDLKGEAYFEVMPGKNFTVKTSTGTVQVLGTRFSVHDDTEKIKVECFEGSVRVSRKGIDQLLVKGEGAVLSDMGPEMANLAQTNYPSFARFKAEYVNSDIKQVLKDLEMFFGIKVNSRFKGTRYYTGSFETGSLENALILLCEPLGLNYVIESQLNVIIF